MSQCATNDQDIVQKFPTTLYRSPKFIGEPVVVHRLKTKRRLVRPDRKVKVVEDLKRQLDTTIFRLLVTAQSRQQFVELRKELFPEFVEVSGAISTLVGTRDPNEHIERTNRVFEHLRGVFSSDDFFLGRHEAVRDEAMFCLDTLHRAHFLAQDLLEYVQRGELTSDALKGYQVAISQEWWSILHLCCITFSIRHKVRPSDDVFHCVMQGFRHSVMAYASAREAIDTKYKSDYDLINFGRIEEIVKQEYALREQGAYD